MQQDMQLRPMGLKEAGGRVRWVLLPQFLIWKRQLGTDGVRLNGISKVRVYHVCNTKRMDSHTNLYIHKCRWLCFRYDFPYITIFCFTPHAGNLREFKKIYAGPLSPEAVEKLTQKQHLKRGLIRGKIEGATTHPPRKYTLLHTHTFLLSFFLSQAFSLTKNATCDISRNCQKME